MTIEENVDLSEYSTMRLGSEARYFAVLESKDDLAEAAKFAKEKGVELRVIGGGSNIVFKESGFDGLLAVNKINFEPETEENDDGVIVKFAGGMEWDKAVAFSVDKKLSGIEALSLIPGSVGAGPVQNIGAYGQQLSDVFVELEVYDIKNDEFVALKEKDCKFSYRNSIFKHVNKQRYVITSITLELSKKLVIEQPLYRDIERYFEENKLSEITPKNIREAVIAIRSAKLPDPKTTPNTGSFFANPVITKQEFEKIAQKHPEINQSPEGWPQPPRWFIEDNVKVSAAWLMEQAGFKDIYDKDTGMATWPRQTLVLINKSAKDAADLFKFRDKIQNAVKEKFGIELKQEPETI